MRRIASAVHHLRSAGLVDEASRHHPRPGLQPSDSSYPSYLALRCLLSHQVKFSVHSNNQPCFVSLLRALESALRLACPCLCLLRGLVGSLWLPLSACPIPTHVGANLVFRDLSLGL